MLIPPDYERCQCQISPAFSPFRIGPKERPYRCEGKATWIVAETCPSADDGEEGSMSLCDECMEEFNRRATVAVYRKYRIRRRS